MSKVITHYDNLQVKETASDEVIRGAYRYLSQKWHPDRNPHNRQEAERILKIINRAYAILSDPIKRKEHDEWIRRQREDLSGFSQSPPPPPPPPPPPHEESNFGEEIQPDSSGDEVLGLFVGNKYAYYRLKWGAVTENGRGTSWNWAAFFLGLGWMAYRKMYMYSFIFIALMVVEILAEIAFNIPNSISTAVTFGIAGLLGGQGNYWYKLHAERKVKEILAFSAPEKTRLELKHRGGTSLGAAIGFPLLFFVVIALIAFVAEPVNY